MLTIAYSSLSDNVRRSSRKRKNINYSEKHTSNLSVAIESKDTVCSPSIKKVFSSDSSTVTEIDTEVSNDIILKNKISRSKRQLIYSSDEETCEDKGTKMTSYDHLPPPIVNVAQGSNSLSANEDNWLLNVFNNGRMNRNDIDVMSNTSSKQNTSTQQNTSIIHNTSTKPNESFEIDSTYLKDIQCEDDSELFRKPPATIDHIINPSIEDECILQATIVDSPTEGMFSEIESLSPSTQINISIDEKIENLKKEFDKVHQKMSTAGSTTYQSYIMNKQFLTSFEDTCEKFKTKQDEVSKKAQQVIFSPEVMTTLMEHGGEIMTTFIQQQELIALNGKYFDKVWKTNGILSSRFEDIFKNMRDLEKNMSELKDMIVVLQAMLRSI